MTALTLKTYVLIRMIVHAGFAIFWIAALKNGTSPRTAGRRRAPRKHHILIEILLLVAILGVSEGVAVASKRTSTVRWIRNAALGQSLQIVVKGIGRKGRRFARVITILLKSLTGRRWGDWTWHVKVRGVVLLRGEHLRYAESLPFSNASVYLAELAAKYILDIGNSFRRACKYSLNKNVKKLSNIKCTFAPSVFNFNNFYFCILNK